MDRQQKRVILAMSVLGLLYFVLFIPPNLTGAKDVNMISAFEHDEFAQYPHLIDMLTGGETLYQTLRNFLIYQHYYYGYPFYFISALAVLPYKLIAGSVWTSRPDIIMLLLRQLINVLPHILSMFFIVWMVDRFRSWWKAILIMVLLLLMPAVVGNNMWWHPDGLLLLFCTLTLFFLVRDDFAYGKNFRIAGMMTGLAIGVKILGVLFVLTYLVYLVYGLINKRLNLKKFILSAVIEILIVLGTVIISNPLLLLPQERAEIISTFKANLGQSTQGFWVIAQNDAGNWSAFRTALSSSYASLSVLSIALIFTVYGCFARVTRTRNLLLLSWVVGYCAYFLFFASTIRSHYFIPVVPALMISLFSDHLGPAGSKGAKYWKVVLALGIFVSVLQTGLNIPKDVQLFQKILNREQTSGSIQLFTEVKAQYLDRIPDDVKVKIYRDWRAYVQPKSNYRIIYNWELATYSYIQDTNPELLFIEADNARYFSDASRIDQAIKPERMKQMNDFYSDVTKEQVDGYRLLLKTDYGYVFATEDFCVQFLD